MRREGGDFAGIEKPREGGDDLAGQDEGKCLFFRPPGVNSSLVHPHLKRLKDFNFLSLYNAQLRKSLHSGVLEAEA